MVEGQIQPLPSTSTVQGFQKKKNALSRVTNRCHGHDLKESVFNYFHPGKLKELTSLNEEADNFHWLSVLTETTATC